MSSPLSIAVHGASGRMGRAILRIAFERPSLRVAAAIVGPESANAGKSLRAECGEAARNLAFSTTLAAASGSSVLVDFSTPAAFDAALAFAIRNRLAFVSGTTGLSSKQQAALRDAGTSIAVLWSANFSIGIAVLTKLVREAARALPNWDAEIFEAHHRDKKDAPSGTALSLGRALADARGADFESVARYDRTVSSEARERDAIGFASIRAGDIVGEHSVVFATNGERIELAHRASDRDIFARGALDAATWIVTREPGVYALLDLLAQ